jgi:hypothetical protein
MMFDPYFLIPIFALTIHSVPDIRFWEILLRANVGLGTSDLGWEEDV